MIFNPDINVSLPNLQNPNISQQRNQNGNPIYPNIHPQSYQMNLAFQQELVRQKRQYIIKMLEEKFPQEFALIYSSLIFFIGVVQIILTCVKREYDIESVLVFGILGGVPCILLGVLSFSLIKWKNYFLIVVAFIFLR